MISGIGESGHLAIELETVQSDTEQSFDAVVSFDGLCPLADLWAGRDERPNWVERRHRRIEVRRLRCAESGQS